MAAKDPTHCAPTRSSYAPVARSSSTSFLEERAIARRWTVDEIQARIAEAPTFRFDRPPADLLEGLVQQYQIVTGDQIATRRPNKRNLLAACYRVHGADVIPYIADEFAVRGTAQNLLGIIRSSPPRGTEDVPPPLDHIGTGTDPSHVDRTSAQPVAPVLDRASGGPTDHDGPPCPIERCLPGLIYCECHRPVFDPRSRRRYDRRRSNPDAARYFGDQIDSSGSGSPTTPGTRAR
jgi:hypothetical protein